MKKYLLFILFYLSGCASKTKEVLNQKVFNFSGADGNSTSNYTISGSDEIDYVNPSMVLLILGVVVFVISFFPIFYGFCLCIKKKVLTFFNK
jgi:hypothetical protein